MASSGGGEAGATSTNREAASPSPRLRGDSITDDDPWIANKRFDVIEGGGRQQDEEKGGGRGLPAVLSPRFLKRSKRSETAGNASRERDKALVAALIDKEKGKSTKKKGSVGSADDLSSPNHPIRSDEPKSPRGRARGQLLRSFSQTALVDSRNKSELAKRERLKQSGELSTAAAAAGAARSPRSDSAARTAAAASQTVQGHQLNKSAPRFHSFSQQEKKDFEQKIKGSNIQFFRNTKKSKKGPIYRNVLEGADQALPWSGEIDTVIEVVDAGAEAAGEAEVSDDDDFVSERRARLQQQHERRGSDSSDPGSSDCDDTSPRPKRKITSPPVPLLSPRGGGGAPTSPKASYLTPEQLKEMVRERKLEIKREREREKREEKEKAKREKEELKGLKQKKQQAAMVVKRTNSRDDQPFPGISLANDKVKSLLEREPAESAGSAGEDRPTTPRRPSQAAEEYMESPRTVPPPLTLSQAGAVAVRAGAGASSSTSAADSGAVHSPPPASPRVVASDSPQKAAPAADEEHKKKLEQAQQQKEQHQREQEQLEKQLKLEAERRKKYKKQISIHLGMSKQQRRSRSFSDLTHYFTDQPDDGKAQGRKKEKKEKKEKKKEKKDKKDKKDKHAAVNSKDAPKPLVPEVTVTESTATGPIPSDDSAPTAKIAVDKGQPKSEAAATVFPRIAVATGQDREQELREIREMLSFRTKKSSTTAPQAAAGPVDRKSARERKKTLYRSNSEQHLKLLTAKIPSMLLQEKISGGKGLKSQIVLSRPERELIDRQVDIAEKMDEMNRGKNGSRVRKRGDKVAKDRLRPNAIAGAGGDSDSDDDGESEEESDNEKNEEEQKNEGQRVFVQVQRGPVFGMTLDEVMRLQQSSTSPPTSPQPSPSLTSPLSGSPMSCSPPGSPLGMSASMSSVNTAAAVHFTLSKDEARLPVVLTALANGILELGGTQMTGLFRVPGKKSTMDVIRDRLNSGIYQFEEGTCPHDLASLMKEWLKSITPPLIPLELYDRCVEVSGRPNDCVEVIEKSLPDLNRRIIKYVVRFLQQQILSPEVQRATRMDIRSIATAFAPCFLDNPILSMEELVKNIQAHIKFMVNLLMLLNVNVGKISSNAVPVRKLKDGNDDDGSASPSNEESEEAAAKESEGSRIIPKMVNERFKKWQERSKTKGSASARVTRGERKRSIEKRE